MICLDTNFLILSLISGTREQAIVREWISRKETISVSISAWYEFLCKASIEDKRLAQLVIGTNILPLNLEVVGEAARLFQVTGHRRKLKYDVLIAAAAIINQVPLATNNKKDFELFIEHGLKLMETG